MEIKYQVFISSTYKDLIEERTKVRDSILKLEHFPVGMEMFSASDESQWSIIKKTIASSDYYVIIVAHRYGSTFDTGEHAGKSYTEREYDYALELGIPILTFIIDDGVSVKPENMETDAHKKEALDSFKKRISKDRLVEWWTNPDDLAAKVSLALIKSIKSTERPGWIRGDTFEIKINELKSELENAREENRRLRETEKKADLRSPKLSLHIDLAKEEDPDDVAYDLYHHDNLVSFQEGVITINTPSFKHAPFSIDSLKVTMKDCPEEDKRYITEDDIERYNNALPSISKFKPFLEDYEKYQRIKGYGVALSLSLQNIGSAKASSASFSIKFPEELKVYDIYDVVDIEEPTLPKMPKSLKEIAAERKPKNPWNMLEFSKLSIPNQLGYKVSVQELDRIEFEGNTISNSCNNDLLHYKQMRCGEFYLVPSKAGIYDVVITYMCEEYEKPVEEHLTINCEEFDSDKVFFTV